MNLGEIIHLTFTRLRQYNNIAYTKQELIVLANAIHGELTRKVKTVYQDYFLTSQSYSMVNGTYEYDLPDDFVQLKDLRRTDVTPNVPLTPIKFDNIWQYQSTTGTSTPLYWCFSTISSTGTEKIAVADTPNANVTNYMKLWYFRHARNLGANTDVPDIPIAYHDLIPDMMVYDLVCSYDNVGVDRLAKRIDIKINQMLTLISKRQVQTYPKMTQVTDFGENPYGY